MSGRCEAKIRGTCVVPRVVHSSAPAPCPDARTTCTANAPAGAPVHNNLARRVAVIGRSRQAVVRNRLIEIGESPRIRTTHPTHGKLASRKRPQFRTRPIAGDRGQRLEPGPAESLLGIDCGFVTAGRGIVTKGTSRICKSCPILPGPPLSRPRSPHSSQGTQALVFDSGLAATA